MFDRICCRSYMIRLLFMHSILLVGTQGSIYVYSIINGSNQIVLCILLEKLPLCLSRLNCKMVHLKE